MLPIDERTGVIFDIQSFSLQDGPGIRTSIFFKGCPLRCLWCHNPESFIIRPQLSYTESLCVGCMSCLPVCSTGAQSTIESDQGRIHVVEHERCSLCGECQRVCCYDALDIVGATYTPRALLDRIRPDKVYYDIKDENGETGGVTLTGGEPMQQVEFIASFLNLTEDIHVAMETCGHASQEDFARIVSNVDLFLFDYKATNPTKHTSLCEVDNEQILANLDFLYEEGAKIILRLPLVLGVNDDIEHLEGIATVLKEYPNIEYGEIMPYHRLGLSKIDKFGLNEMKVDQKDATKEDYLKWVATIQSFGVSNIR